VAADSGLAGPETKGPVPPSVAEPTPRPDV
jgi:hypothetical protein